MSFIESPPLTVCVNESGYYATDAGGVTRNGLVSNESYCQQHVIMYINLLVGNRQCFVAESAFRGMVTRLENGIGR
ncbi:hypothetical protein CGLAMM_03320 [Acetobacteraceae bacterium EV16G]|uniref:Uncharacterized protein n=1 Tax=Sorlinia euscelidii TaxID=3081148 RepID=A0ABU7U2V7_9PROT